MADSRIMILPGDREEFDNLCGGKTQAEFFHEIFEVYKKYRGDAEGIPARKVEMEIPRVDIFCGEKWKALDKNLTQIADALIGFLELYAEKNSNPDPETIEEDIRGKMYSEEEDVTFPSVFPTEDWSQDERNRYMEIISNQDKYALASAYVSKAFDEKPHIDHDYKGRKKMKTKFGYFTKSFLLENYGYICPGFPTNDIYMGLRPVIYKELDNPEYEKWLRHIVKPYPKYEERWEELYGDEDDKVNFETGRKYIGDEVEAFKG